MATSRAFTMAHLRGNSCWVSPPGGPNLRRYGLFGWLEFAWDASTLGLVAVTAAWIVAGAPGRTVASGVALFATAGIITELTAKVFWTKNVFRILGLYYRQWLEPVDSPRFCALALKSHPLALVVLLGSFAAMWAGWLAVAAAARLADDGYSFDAAALFGAGAGSVLVGIVLAAWHRSGAGAEQGKGVAP